MRRKKLWYVPGLYSLLGLPILLLLFGREDVQEPVALRFFIPDDRQLKDDQPRFQSNYVLQLAATKKATTIDFWYRDFTESETYSQHTKLNFIAREIEKLAVVHDTSRVLKIELGEGITYGEFVWILNQVTINGIRRYACVQSTFYIFPNPIRENPANYKSLELSMEDYDFTPIKRPSWWEQFKSDLEWELEYQFRLWSYYIKHNYVLIVGFLLLIVLPFGIRIRKFGKIPLRPQYPVPS
jgi:hypothetical protein